MAYGNVNSPGVTVSEVATEIAKALGGYLPAAEIEKLLSYKVGLGEREQIPASGDLNDVRYLAHKSFGVMGTATARTIQNCPTAVAFMLDNFTCGGNDTTPDGANDYTFQRLIDINGNIWGRNSYTNGAGTRAFGEWKGIHVAGQYIPANQKGAANGVASLDANGDVPFAQIPPYLLYGAGSVGTTTDWNTLPPGAYKVDINSGSGAGAPSGLYKYGSLLHYCGVSAVGGTQIYVPHIGNTFALRTRYEPGSKLTGGWTAWRYFNVNGTSAAIATAPNNTSYTTRQVRNITLSTAAASGGGNGDLFFTYV